MDAQSLEFPVRPYVPPTAFLALGCCVAAAFMLDAGWHRRAEPCIVSMEACGALICCAVGLIICSWFARRFSERIFKRDSRAVWRALAVCSIGVLVGSCTSIAWLLGWQARCRAFSAPVSSYELIVQGDPSVSDVGASSSVDVCEVGTGTRVATARMTAANAYEAGAVLQAVGRVKAFDDSDWARSRFMRGETAGIQVVRVLEVDAGNAGIIGSVRRSMLEAVDPDASEARALLAGAICGRTTELGGGAAQDAFSRCGLTHLIAVSGSHLALIALLLDIGLRHTRASGAMRRAIVLLAMVLYVIFTGCAASAVRSVLMVGVSMGSGMVQRRAHPLSGLSLTVFVLVALNPGIVYDLGFQLSALSVLFLLVFGRYISYALSLLRIPSIVAEPLALTLVAQWATLPLTIPIFGEMSLIAPVANLLVGPLMSALLVVGLPLAPLALVPGFEVLLTIPDVLAQLSLFAAQTLGRVPYASLGIEAGGALAVIVYGLAVLLYLTWWQCSRRMLVGLLAATALIGGQHVVRWAFFAPASVVVLDVGQADAILIREGGRTVLVDAGVDEEVVAALARNNVYRLDAVVITHWDRDHWGGLPDVLDHVPVERLIVAEGAAASMPDELLDAGLHIEELADGDCLRIGAFTCEMVWPAEPVEGEENGESLCLALSYQNDDAALDMLLTGDTERAELARYADTVGDIDVLKVGHHGSAVSVDQETLAMLKPELAVASAGEGNTYGHPDPACVRAVQEVGAMFLCTKDVGDVSMLPRSGGITVEVENPQGIGAAERGAG